MKSVIFLASSLSALASASAVKPFQLVVESADQSINGDYLWPCHSGESTSRFCLGGDGKDLWTFTEAKGAEQSVADYTAPGYLTWVGDLETPMQFYIDPASNVAQPILDTSSDSSQLVSFGIKNEKLVLISDVDDSVVPPAHQPRTASNWHTCTTDLDGVIASAMGWVIGPAGTEPQNPTCSIAEIRRVYV